MSPPARGARRIRAVLFDVGGTLVDERDPIHWSQLAERVGLEAEPEALAHWYDETEKENDRVGNRIGFEEFWAFVLERASGAPVPIARTRRFLELALEDGRKRPVFSDVRWCLERLRRRKLALGIVSNSRSREHLDALLTQAGIRQYFATVVSSGTEGVAKPDPEIFRRAVARLGVPAQETLYVGNLPTVDAKAAIAAGLHGLWLNRGGTGFGEDPPEITSLTELPLAVSSASRAR